MADIMAMAKKMHWTTSTIFGTVFLIIGLIGNTLSLLVWNRKSMQSSTGYYLIAQAIADITVLVFFYLTDSIKMIDPAITTSYAYGVFFAYIGYPVFFLGVVVSIWMTVGVTVDRYIQVCWIHRAKAFCNRKRAFVGIGLITGLCFIVNLPHFKTFYAIPASDRQPSDNAFAFTEFGAGEGSMRYEFWVHCIVLVLVPWFTIFVLNLLIIHRVVKTNQKMSAGKTLKGKDKTRRAENQLTRLLLIVTFTFLVLIALQCITQCFYMLKPKSANLQLVDEAFSVAKLGVVINSSINFFLYCLSGQRFRRELFNLLHLLKSKEDESSIIHNTDSSASTASFSLNKSSKYVVSNTTSAV
ncbi:hypothetical protein FSP39_022110 [Pinctada imbricata]|uniref:G-protein coupled receptors family 1 profile domain-containing protein n=1 Tax=Pinctada imbricata TaxID=66713 RepID=A0AA88XWM3_PINIB|nr:hypothetical protein FSP39_022110 [Pinctada imbricata]